MLVGYETGDDAAVYKINGEQGVIATTDFFMPIVDDPFDYGRIAAANALSDVYAIGGKPIMALAIAGFPMDKMTVEQVQNTLAGGNQVCADAGVPIAGGHTIDAPEPIYGLAVVGLVHPDKIKRNNAAKDGDVLILGKGLGVGILGAALNNDQLDNIGYGELIKSAVKLNSIGNELSEIPGVHAVTDVTGFGLVGHLLEVCSGSNLSATLYWDQLPILPSAINYAQRGFSTGAGNRNWDSFGDDVTLTNALEEWQKNLITDPQTSGG
ncbi:MAG TPA: selenide, water dikinase SelD, partial [Rhodospirillales bacterium]|nr:selenide, water dikinase SelD [Rhodospirillales bacterium]